MGKKATQGNQLTLAQSLFDSIRQTRPDGSEYWTARDMQQALEYKQWRKFDGVIKRAMASCEATGHKVSDQFARADKLIQHGKGGKRSIPDYELTRLACYLVAQNGDPHMPRVAEAQVYFAVSTRENEITKELAELQQRLELRGKTIDGNKALSAAACRAGVTNYSDFYNAGYEGQYGMNKRELNRRRGVRAEDTPLNHMGPVELAANDFRILLTGEALRVNGVTGQEPACDTHFQIGAEVRDVMLRQGVTPEALPVAPNLRPALQSQRRQRLKAGEVHKRVGKGSESRR